MLSPADASPRRYGWVWCLIPVASALAFHAGTLRVGYVLDDAALVNPGSPIERLDPEWLFFESYLSPSRIDPGYRPLTYATIGLERRAGAGAAAQHAVNVIFHAGAAVLVFLLLKDLLGGDAAAPLAAAGAAIFAALPITTDAVARISGRADILAGIATLGAWLVGIRNAPGPGAKREHTWRVVAAGAITLIGLFTRENTAMFVPVLIAASAWLTRRRVPSQTVSTCACAVIGWFAIERVILESRPFLLTRAINPLLGETFLTRSLNGLELMGLHALKVVAPLRLSAEYTVFDLEPRVLTDWVLWVGAAGVVAAVIGAVVGFGRRAPPWALAALAFVLLLAPVANVFFLADALFQERAAYTAAFAWPLALCGVLQLPALARRRSARAALAAALVVGYGAWTLARNEEWVRADPVELTSVVDSPARTRAIHLSLAKHLEKTRTLNARKELRERAAAEAERQLKMDPSDGWAEALEGQLLALDKKPAEAIEHLSKAERLLASSKPPVSDPLLHQLRGDSYLAAGKVREAWEDFERHIHLLESRGERADASAYNHRGLALAQLGNLPGALKDFDAARALRTDLPEIWNNRGFCCFKLGRLDEAIADYQKGLVVCENQGIHYAASGDSVHAFLLRLADVYTAKAQQYSAAGNQEKANEVAADGAKLREEANKVRAAHGPPSKTPPAK